MNAPIPMQRMTIEHVLLAYNQNQFDEAMRMITILRPHARGPELAYIEGMTLLAMNEVDKALLLVQKERGRFDESPMSQAMREHIEARAYLRQNEPYKARPLLEHAVTLLTDNQSCFMDYGQCLFNCNAMPEAQKAFLRALTIGPCTPALFKNIGVCVLRQGRQAEAIAYFAAAWTMEPSGELAIWMAGAQYELKKYNKAKTYFRQALHLSGPTVESLNGLGKCCEQQKLYRRAITYFKEALACATSPAQQATMHRNIAYAHEKLFQLDIAKEHCKKAIALEPENIANRFHLVHIYQMGNNNKAALAVLDDVDKISPNLSDTLYARGFLNLLEGKWEEGWRDYENRWEATHLRERYGRTSANVRSPKWDGKASLKGKLVMAFCEQGYGDYFNFARYCRHLKERGATVDMLIPPHSSELIRSLPWIRNVYTDYSQVPPHDYHISLMSMPLFEGTTPDTIPPAYEPYLETPYKRKRFSDKYTVGITWIGDTENPYDYLRSIPDEQIRPLLDISKDIQFVLIYAGPKTAAMKQWIEEGLLIDGLSGTPNFSDVAAAIDACDLLISVDTANAHVAGAMHKPVWVLLGHYTEWRWLKGTLVERWYPTMRYFRQAATNQWEPLLAEVGDTLRKQLKVKKAPAPRKPAAAAAPKKRKAS